MSFIPSFLPRCFCRENPRLGGTCHRLSCTITLFPLSFLASPDGSSLSHRPPLGPCWAPPSILDGYISTPDGCLSLVKWLSSPQSHLYCSCSLSPSFANLSTVPTLITQCLPNLICVLPPGFCHICSLLLFFIIEHHFNFLMCYYINLLVLWYFVNFFL